MNDLFRELYVELYKVKFSRKLISKIIHMSTDVLFIPSYKVFDVSIEKKVSAPCK